MRLLSLVAGVCTVMVLIVAFCRSSMAPQPEALKGIIVVVSGGSGPKAIVMQPTVALGSAIPLFKIEKEHSDIDHRTALTASELDDLSKLDTDLAKEKRDDAWASYNESRFKGQLRNMGIFNLGKTSVRCGESTCVLSMITEGNQSPYNIEKTLEALPSFGESNAQGYDMTTNKVFSQKTGAGETEFKVQLFRDKP